MPDPSKSPLELTAADITHLRYLAIAWGVVIAAVWLVLDDVRAQLRMTAVSIATMLVSLLSIYLLRRWQSRR